jgi:tetratricopeptide (TPR) repeat protein
MTLDVQDILDRAKGSARAGDHEAAERLLKQYLTKIPESSAEVRQNGDEDSPPDDRSARLLLGTTLVKQGKFDEAAGEFSVILAKDPRDAEALNNLAVIYKRQDKLQDALGALIEAIDIDPTRAEFHYNIGNIHKQTGNLKAASMAYSKVVELDPNYVHAYNNLGTIYDQLHEYNKAYNMFRKGLALDRNNPLLHFNYGVALEANGRFDDAIAEYKAALRSKPGWLQPMNNLGIVYFKQGQHARAMENFNRILHVDPQNAEALNNLGVVFADQGKTRDAVENYRRAIELDPKYVKAVVNLGRALEDSGDFADAVMELEKLIKLVPSSADVRCRLGSLYLMMDRCPEALEQAKSALEWEPENVQAFRIAGTAQRLMGNDAEAKTAFEKILALDPGNYSFHLDLADIHFKHKEYKKAEERVMAYLSRRPGDRRAKLLLGKLYGEMGNHTHAVQVFDELTKADPNDAEALAAAAERAAGDEVDMSFLMGPAEVFSGFDEESESLLIEDLDIGEGEEGPDDWQKDISGEKLPGREFEEEEVPEEEFPGMGEQDLDGKETPCETEASEQNISVDSEAAEEELTREKIAGLMNYLKGLAGSLSDPKKEHFLKSDARLSMEYVINTLEGKKGLLREIREKLPEAEFPEPRLSAPEKSGVDNQKLAGTLSYLDNLSSAMPDKDLLAALRQKVQNIMTRITGVNETTDVSDRRKSDE